MSTDNRTTWIIPSYDARGHLLRKVDGDNDLSFQYDLAERLTLVRETGSGSCVTTDNQTNPPLCLKSFTYATSNGTNAAGLTDYRKGKVTSASRYNYVGDPFNATVEVKETYQYAGRSGRISQKDTYQIFNGGNSEIFRQTFTWDELGALGSQTYPDCIATTICGSTSPRSVSHGYTKGLLTSVSGFASSITYHPNGLVNTVSRSNGLTDYQDRDPKWLTRPAAIRTLRNSDSSELWRTGTYQYDGSGNVWKMGTTTYVYDSLSRVLSGTVYPGAFSNGTAHTQSYTYDSYGNLKSKTTNSVLVNTQTDLATNRLSAGTYDKAGNMIGWSGNTYEYDALNQMKRMVSGAEDWRYMFTADDERFWSYRVGGGGSVWSLRDLNDKVLREYSAHLGWGSYRDYVYRGSTLLASVDSAAAGGAVRHLHTDHLGTPRLITDATGNPATAKFHTYYPFGEEIAGTYTASYTDKMRFTGHERDLANIAGQGDDLDYMHARHYSSVVGRFLSFDPVGGVAGTPQSWNRYAYVLGNPLRYIDPEGLQPLQGYYYGQGVFASTGFYQFNTADRLFYGGANFFALVEAGASSPHAEVNRDFASQVFANVWASTGWLAQAADEGARLFDLTTGYISAADALLLGGDPREAGVIIAAAFIPGLLDNAGLVVVNSSTKVARSSVVRSAFLKSLANDIKTPSWMKQWLSRGRVPPGYNVDHIKPLSVGGLDIISNLRLLLQKDHVLHHKFFHPLR